MYNHSIRDKNRKAEGGFRYEITAEMPAEIVIGGRTATAAPGTYTFWSE